MRKVFHFDSPADPYVADAAVLCCFDARISQAVRKFLRRQSIERPDMIIVAGGRRRWLHRATISSRTSSSSRCACRFGWTRRGACW